MVADRNLSVPEDSSIKVMIPSKEGLIDVG